MKHIVISDRLHSRLKMRAKQEGRLVGALCEELISRGEKRPNGRQVHTAKAERADK